jgi:hypothetical protein
MTTTQRQGPTDLAAPAAHQNNQPQPPSGETPLRPRSTCALTKPRLARGLGAPSGEVAPRSRAGRPLGWGSASLEGWTPPRVRFRLARGSHGLAAPVPAPPTGAFNVLTHACAQVKDESAPRRSSDTPGNHIPALFRRPSRWSHPRHCTTLCGKAAVSSVTLCHPLSYGRRATPSKEDGGTLEKGTDVCSALAQDNAVTSDQWGVSPPSPSALCGHPRHHDAIPGTAPPSPTLWEYGATRHRHACCCAPYGLPSAAPSSQRTDDDQTGSSHTATLETAPRRIHGTPWRSARSLIRQDGRLLCNIVHHTATRN